MGIGFGSAAKLLTNVSTALTGPVATCQNAIKTFSFGITGSGTMTLNLYGSDDGSIFGWLATVVLDVALNPGDVLLLPANSLTQFKVVTSSPTGSPVVNAHVTGVD